MVEEEEEEEEEVKQIDRQTRICNINRNTQHIIYKYLH